MAIPKANQPFARVLLLSVVIPASFAIAQDDIEDPSVYPDSWYRIILDSKGDYVSGDGDGYGGGWYYYPDTGWYRQWFYNQAYDANRRGALRYEIYIKARDPNESTYVTVYADWTTPEWSQLDRGGPPLPDDAPTAGDEYTYMGGEELYVVDGWRIGTVEPIRIVTVEDYNPEWVAISIRGRNAYVYRGVMRECVGKEGACCDPVTEDCYLSREEDCDTPYKWLGPDTSCEKCGQNMSWQDFGDAPDSYGTSAANDGAQHTVVSGIYLGRTVDVELDGMPGPMATGDDLQGSTDDEDGVVFTAPLSPGNSTTVEVTASVQGYLNAWIDYDQDGSFDGAGEQVFTDELLTQGVNRLTVRIPESAVQGSTFARFRFNTRGLLRYSGSAADGEVEDYRVSIMQYLEPQSNSGKGGLKWSQPVQPYDAATPYILNGWDEPSGLHLHQIAADDWECKDTGPITGFQWWGSFQGWTEPLLPSELPLAFHIAIWTNGSGPGSLRHPDTLVWETFCTHWTWNVAGYDSDPRGLNDDICFQFTSLLSQDRWFYPSLAQQPNGTPTPAIYWISIAALYDTRGATPAYPWGWSTRPQAFSAGAVRIQETRPAGALPASWPPVLGSQWLSGTSIEHPKGVAWDMAFELLTNQAAVDVKGPDLAPVYRFWSGILGGHFYTIDEAEKEVLVKEYSDTWTFEGIAFYAYPPGKGPAGSKPVYRFWSDLLGHHFYTISESEKQKIADEYSNVWHLEGVAWEAFE